MFGKSWERIPCKRVRTVVPSFAERYPAAPDRVEAEPVIQVGRDLEARREDQQIQRILLTVDDHAVLIDLAHATAVGVNEMDIGLVERGQVFIVETDPFAMFAIPGLELVGRLRIIDDFVHPPA